MGADDFTILVVGGIAAGVINTLAGGGSLISVGLLVFLGLPGTVANGTNRVGVLVQYAIAAWRFRAEGVSGFRRSLPVLIPLLLGSLIGAFGISRVTPAIFERLFGVVMLALLVPLLRPTVLGRRAPPTAAPWPPALRTAVFFAIGVYGDHGAGARVPGNFDAGGEVALRILDIQAKVRSVSRFIQHQVTAAVAIEVANDER